MIHETLSIRGVDKIKVIVKQFHFDKIVKHIFSF